MRGCRGLPKPPPQLGDLVAQPLVLGLQLRDHSRLLRDQRLQRLHPFNQTHGFWAGPGMRIGHGREHPYQVTLRSTTRGDPAAMTYPKSPTQPSGPE
jgi:hypothetical protein